MKSLQQYKSRGHRGERVIPVAVRLANFGDCGMLGQSLSAVARLMDSKSNERTNMHWTDRRRRFRTILKGDRCYHPASVFDPLSARLAQDLGFEVGMFAGSTASLTVLGAPDLILITLSEFAEQAYRINRAFDLPLLVDADHGYGNALNVMRTVQELESAGVAALTIEDTVLPRPYGAPGRDLTSIEEGVGRMRAALAARQDPDLVIVGRTIAMGATGTEDALARAKAYAAAGVDAFFFVGITERAQLEAEFRQYKAFMQTQGR